MQTFIVHSFTSCEKHSEQPKYETQPPGCPLAAFTLHPTHLFLRQASLLQLWWYRQCCYCKCTPKMFARIPSVWTQIQIHIPHDVVTIPRPPDAFETSSFSKEDPKQSVWPRQSSRQALPHTDLPVKDRDECCNPVDSSSGRNEVSVRKLSRSIIS